MAEFSPPRKAAEAQPIIFGLRGLVQLMEENKKLSVDQRQTMASLLRQGREVLTGEVKKGGEMLDVLEKVVEDRSGNFRNIYGAVFELISKEVGFTEFTDLAAKVAKDTKLKHPDFYQSASDFLPIWMQAIAIKPKFEEFCQAVAAKAGAKLLVGPIKASQDFAGQFVD